MRTLLTPLVVTSPTGALLHGLVRRPLANPLGPTRRPAVVLFPGGVGAGRMMTRSPAARRLAESGVVVVGYNAEGRVGGRWDLRSGGRGDLNGPVDQDGLAAVVRHVAALPDVDPARLGLLTVSYGLVAAAGAVARHPDLPVAFLIDEEGPADPWSAMLRAWTLADLGDRPDRSQKATDLFGWPPPEPGERGPHADFWRVRDPSAALGAFRGRYLRLQAEFDHVQPPRGAEQVPLFDQPPRWFQGCHAVTLVNAAIDGGVPWVRVNPAACGNPVNQRWSAASPPRWLPGKMEEHPGVWEEAVGEVVGVT